MTETGRVREIRENLVVIQPDRSAACFGCMNQECKTSGGLLTAENRNALPLQTGQTVEVSARGANLLGQAFAALLPPALGFAAGFAAIRLFFPESGEAAPAGAGAVCMFAAAFAVYAARKKHPAKREYEVTKILEFVR